MIAALRKRYPQAYIAWLAEPAVVELLLRHPQLDEVIVWRKAEWKKLWKERQFKMLWRNIREFTRDLRGYHFDTAIDAQGLLKSGIWARLSGAKRRIGLGSREGSHRLMTENVDKLADSDVIGSEYRHLADYLGLENDPFPMLVGLNNNDHDYVDDIVQQYSLKAGYVVIAPFTTRPQKHWFSDAWIQLIDQCQKQLQLSVIMLGGPADKVAAKVIASESSVINLTGETSIPQAAALIANCQLLIGVDTGLTHLGTAFERPTICLFGSTKPYLQTDSERTHIIYHELECSPCRRNPVCNVAFTCMRDIRPKEVIAAAEKMLLSSV